MRKQTRSGGIKSSKLPILARWGWGLVFGLWILILTGLPHDAVRRLGLGVLKAPGYLQYSRLQDQISSLEKDLAGIRQSTLQTQARVQSLEKDPSAQTREARRVLGWVSPDEIVFEFEK